MNCRLRVATFFTAFFVLAPGYVTAQNPVAGIADNIKERIQQGNQYGKTPASLKMPSVSSMEKEQKEKKDKESGNQKAQLIDSCSRLDGKKLQSLCLQKVLSN